jgi:hypothetical protein
VKSDEGRALAEKYNVPFFETSALSGINVVAAFTVIYLRILPENVLETRP